MLKYLALLLLPVFFIRWSVIPHDQQRYDTVGDWKWDGYLLRVTASRLHDKRYHFLVLTHETLEALLCALVDVHEQAVTEYDEDYERQRRKIERIAIKGSCGCWITKTSEPGNDRHAPYHYQHAFATKVERVLAALLWVDWQKYGDAIDHLEWKPLP